MIIMPLKHEKHAKKGAILGVNCPNESGKQRKMVPFCKFHLRETLKPRHEKHDPKHENHANKT